MTQSRVKTHSLKARAFLLQEKLCRSAMNNLNANSVSKTYIIIQQLQWLHIEMRDISQFTGHC